MDFKELLEKYRHLKIVKIKMNMKNAHGELVNAIIFKGNRQKHTYLSFSYDGRSWSDPTYIK